MKTNLQHLAERHAAEPTPANREAVVLAAVPLVRSLVGRLSIPNHPLASKEDLENVGLLGILQALDAYDPSRGTPFASYAYGRMRGALVDYLRSIDALSRDQRKRLAQAQTALETLRQMTGADPKDHEVADFLGISLSDYHRLLASAQRRFALSLHHSESGGDEGAQSVVETIPNEEAESAFEAVDRASMHAYVAQLVQELPEREQNIVALYYFEGLTLREIASLLGLTEARISQILGKILLTLRTRLNTPHAQAA